MVWVRDGARKEVVAQQNVPAKQRGSVRQWVMVTFESERGGATAY